jgi:hypothetical protein
MSKIFIDNLNSYLGLSLLEELSSLPETDIKGTLSDDCSTFAKSSNIELVSVISK